MGNRPKIKGENHAGDNTIFSAFNKAKDAEAIASLQASRSVVSSKNHFLGHGEEDDQNISKSC